jgi:hypothetical protein
MATPTKQNLIDALTKQNVPLTGDETVAELKALIEANAITLTEPEEIPEAKPGIIKEWTHNGHKMRRVRDEHGRITDVRL